MPNFLVVPGSFGATRDERTFTSDGGMQEALCFECHEALLGGLESLPAALATCSECNEAIDDRGVCQGCFKTAEADALAGPLDPHGLVLAV